MTRAFWLDRGWYIAWNLCLVLFALGVARLVLIQPVLDRLDRLIVSREGAAPVTYLGLNRPGR